MYKALIVDDDVAVLAFLTKMISWEQYGYRLIGACSNAHDALEMSKEQMPDLIITDIGMPGMDGIEFIKALQQIDEHPRFVILSCHDDFKFAQQAVQLGVQDYILKETLQIELVQGILERLYRRLEEDSRLHKKVEKLHYQAVKSKSVWKEQWLRDFLTTPLADKAKWREQLAEYGLNPDMSHMIPVACSVFRFQDALTRYQNEDMVKFIICNALEELLQQEPNAISFSYSPKQFCFLFACRKDLATKPDEWAEQICKQVQRTLSKVLKIQVSFFIGEIEQDFTAIKQQLLGLLHADDQAFYSAEPQIFKSGQFRLLNNPEDWMPFYSGYTEQVHHLIVEGNKDVQPVVDAFVQFVAARRIQPIMVKHFLFKLMLDIQMKLTFSHQYNNEKMQGQLEEMDNIGQLREWMIRFFERAVSLMDQISTKSKKAEIIDAQKYVLLHLDQKITLVEVAERLFLNASYFSRLFKKETGENFIEYVNRMKMERAKELLQESNRTIEDIALALGYDNKGYFVKLFKNHYGVPPSRVL
ncbi:response regulator [Paenibacillus hodogayensis]|uniref:Response regulator n=1 Tax=Paenibacillus hodogayensis TaxID=279208 RepID=A0ABV5VSZ2_9BACL